MTDGPDIDVTADGQRRQPSVHRWWARRGRGASTAVLLLTNDPEGASDAAFLQRAADPDSIEGQPLDGKTILDLCSGAGTVAEAAQRLGARVTALDNHPVPVLIARATLELPPLFGKPNGDRLGSTDDGTWAGLADELRHWSVPLIERWKERAGSAWLGDGLGLCRSRVLRCAACGFEGACSSAPAPDAFPIVRGSARCPSCSSEARARDLATGAFKTRLVVSSDRNNEVRPPTDALIEIEDYPAGALSQLDEVWVAGRIPLTFREATSPRQAQLLRAAQESFRSVRDELADLGYAPDHAAALLTMTALALSGLVDQLSTVARWDGRRRVIRGLDRAEWTWSPEFVEVGGTHLESQLRRRIDDLVRVIESGPLEPTVAALSGDMRSLPLDDADFDLVVWDPPFYDNIDYERNALPFTRFLRALIGDLHPQLQWAGETPTVVPRGRLDHERYREDLRQASSEIARVLRPGGRLGVFWIVNGGDRTTDDLSAVLEALEPAGLELIQSAALRTESSAVAHATSNRSSRQQVFLVFRQTKGARPANAATVLEGAVSGRSVTYRALVDLLMENLEDEDIEDLIPSGYRGTTEQRLLELVLSQPDPRDLLAELPKRSLRTFIEDRTEPGSATNLSRGELEDAAFGLLGWQLPQEPAFTIGAAIDEAERLTSQLRLARDEDEIRGTASSAFDRIEQVARFTVTTWASWLRSDEWRTVLDEVVGRSERLTFGDWVQALAEVPGRYASEEKLVGQINSRLRRSKVVGSLKEVVALRNRFAHTDGEGLSWSDLRDETVKVLQGATKRLRSAEEAGALPEVLQPLRETRDTYGRITLRLTGHRGQVEFLMSEPSDLTHPAVVLRGETNPREFDPVRLPAEMVSERASIVRS